MKKKIIIFFVGIMAITVAYIGLKELTKEITNDILDINDDLEF